MLIRNTILRTLLSAVVIGTLGVVWSCSDEFAVQPVSFSNRTVASGLERYTPSFSIVVADIDEDGTDDLFVGHHGFPPALYLNRNLEFVEATEALPPPLKVRGDRHGYTFVDFDNDGDKDFVAAGGGADGIGAGMPNAIYKNMLVESGRLEFIDVTSASDISNPTGRTRQFLPIPNTMGDKVDIYSTGLHQGRENSRNIYAVNNSNASQIVFNTDVSSSLALGIASDGKDLFCDLDRDGWMDFVSVGQGQVKLYKNNEGTFARMRTSLDKVWGFISVACTDLDNDGLPDLYLGAGNGQTKSDHVVSNGDEIHFFIQKQDGDDIDQATFKTASNKLKINFTEHIPSQGKNRTNTSDIFLGASKLNPKKRMAQVNKNKAAGKPQDTDRPGIYLWYEPEDDLWRILWKHDASKPSSSKGIVYGKEIQLLTKEQLETVPAGVSQDSIAINKGANGWTLLAPDELRHKAWTNSLTAADFNNDGYVDIVGVRTQGDAQENGDPFIVMNGGNLRFSSQTILQNTEDDIFRADLVVHGFFNQDGLPDIFYTNGFGLLPSHVGPYQFWINTTDTTNGYVLLDLEGTTSNRDAIGAQVELYDETGKLLGYRELGSDFGRSQNSHKVHFGVGDALGLLTVRVRWPGKDQWEEFSVKPNEVTHIRQT